MCDPCVNVVLQNVVEELYTGLWDSIAVNLHSGVDTGHQDPWCRRFRVVFTFAMQEWRYLLIHARS